MFPAGIIASDTTEEPADADTDKAWLHSSTYSERSEKFPVPVKAPSKPTAPSKKLVFTGEKRSDPYRSSSEPPKKKPAPTNIIFLEDVPGLSLSDAYHLDRSSNRQIYTFGSIYEKHVAQFRRKPNTPILGFRSLRVCDLCDTQQKENSTKRVKKSRYFSKASRAVFSKPAQKFPNSEVVSDIQPILRFLPDYISVSTPVNDSTNVALTRCESLNRKVYDAPNDVRAWLELMDMQAKEAVFLHVTEAVPSSVKLTYIPASLTMGDRLLILQKQLSIAERALTANPGSLSLKILTLRIGEMAGELQSHGASGAVCQSKDSLFQPERVGRDWAQLVFTYPQLVPVWRGYIAHLMGKYSTPPTATPTIGSGLFARIDGVFKKALSTLAGIICGRILSHRPQPDTAEQAIDFLADYCHWLVQAGHAERALATWQAVIEFNLFRPSDLTGMPTDQCLLEMELFWSSGAARFGQPGSEHWSGWYRANRRGHSTEQRHRKAKKPPSGLYPVEELQPDATAEQSQSKWVEVAEKLKSIASTCEDALIQCSAELLTDDAQQKLDIEIVPSVLSSAVSADQWTRRGAVPSLAGNASLGKSRAVQYRRGKAWVGLERAREAVGWLPADTLNNTDVEEEDPDRLVLFDDVKPCLLELYNLDEKAAPSSGDAQTRLVALQQRLILQCLEFLGAYEPDIAKAFQLPADLRVVHDLTHIGPIQRQGLSPLLGQNVGSVGQDSTGVKDKFAHLAGSHQKIWAQARRCFLDSALIQVSHLTRWKKEVQTQWATVIGRLRLQLALDRLLDGIQTHNLSTKTVIATWRHCGRSVMAEAQNQHDLELWQSYAMGFWRAALLFTRLDVAPEELETMVSQSRRIFDTALTTYPIPDDASSPPADVVNPALIQFYDQSLGPRFKLIQHYVDLELGVFPGVGAVKRPLGCESRALQLLVQAANGGTYTAPEPHATLRPSILVRTSHAYGKRMEMIWRTLVSLPEDSRLDPIVHGPLLSGLTSFAPVVAYLSLMFDLLTTDEESLSNSLPSLISVLQRIDRLRSALSATARDRESRWSDSEPVPSVRYRVCMRRLLSLIIAGLAAFGSLRQRNHRSLMDRLFKVWELGETTRSAAELPCDLLFPSQLTHLLPPRAALEKSLLPVSLVNAASCQGLLPPLFLSKLIRQLGQFGKAVAELAAQNAVDNAVSGTRISGAHSVLDPRSSSNLLGADISMLSGSQLDSYAGCLPVALDLFILSLELERWLSLIAGVSATSANGRSIAVDSTSSQRVRNAFERAVRAGPFVTPMLSEHGQLHHIVLAATTPSFWTAHLRLVVWRAYMAFGWMSETSQDRQFPAPGVTDPRKRRQAIKSVFYRAVEDLPWAKVLYTDLVRYCPEDVEEIVDLLSERELRLRTPLEEIDLLLTARPQATE
ncbi:Protein nrde2 [Clonorchis sinensis]|uniref:Protein nrde2 n=1 Tax=Clonorchis sinensis TaxID=79923 RepID=A0A8T1M4L7_CLOSI|nr:Protein nrde2 [Clonorchis sinensis]